MNADAVFRNAMQADPSDPLSCWVWQRAKDRWGYGAAKIDGRSQRVHRWTWEFFNGPIPDGLHIDHLCRNKSCVNPWHMEPVTIRVNSERAGGIAAEAMRARVTGKCRKGHDLQTVGLYRTNDYRQVCAECQRQRVYSRRGFQRRVDAALDVIQDRTSLGPSECDLLREILRGARDEQLSPKVKNPGYVEKWREASHGDGTLPVGEE